MGGGAGGPGGRRRRGGFTLLELVVSLLILAVMAAVAAPAFLTDRPPPDLDDAEGRLEALFRLARDSAVRTATPVSVVLDSVSSRVWLDARTRMAAQLPAEAEDAPGAGSSAPRGVLPDGSIRLRTEGAFAGGSTLGVGLDGGVRAGRVLAGGESLDLPASVTLELFQARSLFTFSPNGSVVGDSLRLRSSSGEVRLLTLDPWTGRVRVR